MLPLVLRIAKPLDIFWQCSWMARTVSYWQYVGVFDRLLRFGCVWDRYEACISGFLGLKCVRFRWWLWFAFAGAGSLLEAWFCDFCLRLLMGLNAFCIFSSILTLFTSELSLLCIFWWWVWLLVYLFFLFCYAGIGLGNVRVFYGYDWC